MESFLRLGGQFYHSYPHMVKERGRDFRDGKIEILDPSEGSNTAPGPAKPYPSP